MKTLKTQEGYNMQVLNPNERKQLENVLFNNTPSLSKLTTGNGLTYSIISEDDTDFDNIITVIQANGKRKTIKSNLCNNQQKITQAVKQLYK